MTVRPFSYIATFFAGLCALAISACTGPVSSFAPAAAQPQRVQATRPLTGSPTPTPIPFEYQTVDDPNSLWNEVTAINSLSKIVGTYGSGQSSTLYAGYTSQPPYTKFRSMFDPGSQGTVVTSLSSTKTDAGYVIEPSGHSGTWGFLRINGVWNLIIDPNEGSGGNAVTEILSLNDKKMAAGFYVNNLGTKIPTVLNITTGKFTDLQPPGASGNAEATGINDRNNGQGDITGWEQTASQGVIGFFDTTGTYYPIWFNGATATYPLSINYDDQIAGYYVDSKGANHGFVLTGPSNGGKAQIWQTIDEPNAAYGTWVTGINTHDDICGYYIDSSHRQHGFVAVP
jgi:hypothetical protein